MAVKVKNTYRIDGFRWLVRTVFRDIYEGRTKKVWVLGAGASIDSGICGAASLTHRWSCQLLNLPETTSKEDCLKAWKREDHLKSYNDDINRLLKEPGPEGRRLDDFLAQCYFDVYSRRFSGNPESGYEVLRKEMDGKLPSVGYLVLAQLISTNSNLVVTVNFDSLIADALFLTGKSIPLVLDHENVAHLARPDRTISKSPLVCKIHRDLLKNPMSTEQELQQLNEKWEIPLNEIFKYYSPIFLGYGGNDHTLMDHLEKVGTFLPTPIWLHYTSVGLEDHDAIRAEVSAPITNFLARHDGILVPFTGFDRLMFYARQELNMSDVLVSFDERSKIIRQGLESKINELARETGESASNDAISKASVESVKQERRRSIDEWITIASSEPDLQKRITIYSEAIKENEHFWLYNNRGVAKDNLGLYEEAIQDYNCALELNRNYALAYNNRGWARAQLKDFEEAIQDLDKAIELDRNYANAYNNRGWVNIERRLFEDAIKDFNKTIELDPGNALAYNNRGLAKRHLNRFREALHDFDKAIDLDAKMVLPYFNNPVDLDVKMVFPYYNKARVFATDRQVKEAMTWLEKAISLNKDYVGFAANNSDFDSVRETPEYKALMAKYLK